MEQIRCPNCGGYKAVDDPKDLNLDPDVSRRREIGENRTFGAIGCFGFFLLGCIMVGLGGLFSGSIPPSWVE